MRAVQGDMQEGQSDSEGAKKIYRGWAIINKKLAKKK